MIRDIEESEICACVNLIRASFLTIANAYGFTEENAPRFTAFAISEEGLQWQLEKEQRIMRIYCLGNKILGYYSLAMQENKECELNNLCVLPSCRHKGVGRELLQDAMTIATKLKCKKINIGIVEENQILRKWYESFGFIHMSTQKFEFFPFTCGYMEREL